MSLSEKKEKALLEWVSFLARERAWGAVARAQMQEPQGSALARAYLASLEEKPEPMYGICPACNASWPLAEGHDCSKSPALSACAKPEPKRGVEEILEYAIALYPENMTDMREALRLYREERERVERAAKGLRAAAADSRKRPWGYAANEPWVTIHAIADELERRDG